MSLHQSQWPRGLRRRSAAERLLGSWVRIPPVAWIFVSCECLCCQVEVSAKHRSLVQRSPTDCVCLSVIKQRRKKLDTYREWVEEVKTTTRKCHHYASLIDFKSSDYLLKMLVKN
jgi:hypothetical protein